MKSKVRLNSSQKVEHYLMDFNKIQLIDLFNERKEHLFRSFESIYEVIISKLNTDNTVSSDTINSLIESTTKKIVVSEREQFIFYLTTIITEMAQSVNLKSPNLITQFADDINEFNSKYDSKGQFSTILAAYFAKTEKNSNQIRKIPTFKSFCPNYLGFSFEASLIRSNLLELRSMISKSLKDFSTFSSEYRKKCQQLIQRKKPKNNSNFSNNLIDQTSLGESILKILNYIDSNLQDQEKLNKIKKETTKILQQMQINSTTNEQRDSTSKDNIIHELQSQINDLKIELMKSSISQSQIFNSANSSFQSDSVSNIKPEQDIKTLNEQESEILQLKTQIKSSFQKVQQLTESNRSKDQIIDELKRQIEDNSIQLEVYTSKIKQLKQEIKSLQNDSSPDSFLTSKYSSKDSVFMQTIAEKMEVIANQENIIQQLQKENKTFKNETEIMQEHKSISAKQVQMLKDDLAHVQNSSLSDINEMSLELKTKAEFIRMQNDKIAEFDKIKDKTEKYYQLKYEYKKTLLKYTKLKGKWQSLQIQSQQLLEKAMRKIETINEDYQNLKYKYEKKKKVNEYLVEQNQYLNNSLEILKTTKGQSTQTMTSEQTQNDEVVDSSLNSES